jgi:hypothetical protein
MDSENIVIWNVHGLNGHARHDVVVDLVHQERCSLLCIQETKWAADKQYSMRSTYRAFCIGQCGLPGAKELAKAKAPPSVKFFVWTMLLPCCGTLEQLQWHGLQSSGQCALCRQVSESIEHLLLNCVYAREVWFALLHQASFQQLCPVLEISMVEWWLRQRKEAHADYRKGFDSLVVLVPWHLWKECNACIFDGLSRNTSVLVSIVDEGRA